jgi:RNA polymerase sigma factor (sigma-70 family)
MVKKNKKISIGNSILQSKIQEIPMPQELMEQIFDASKKIGYETEEEAQLRNEKEIYNKSILRQIKKIALTARQREIMSLLYSEGLTLTSAADRLGVKIGTIQEIRDAAIKKIKAKIKYDFKYRESALL